VSGHHADLLWCAAPDPRGRWLATGGEDGLVKVWGARDMLLRATLRGFSGGVSFVLVSPHGAGIAASEQEGSFGVVAPGVGGGAGAGAGAGAGVGAGAGAGAGVGAGAGAGAPARHALSDWVGGAASPSPNALIRVWTPSGRPRAVLHGHRADLNGLAWDPTLKGVWQRAP
jgi:hypothetical protein